MNYLFSYLHMLRTCWHPLTNSRVYNTLKSKSTFKTLACLYRAHINLEMIRKGFWHVKYFSFKLKLICDIAQVLFNHFCTKSSAESFHWSNTCQSQGLFKNVKSDPYIVLGSKHISAHPRRKLHSPHHHQANKLVNRDWWHYILTRCKVKSYLDHVSS